MVSTIVYIEKFEVVKSMSPQIKTPKSAFLFEEGPRFRAIDRGSILLEVDPKRSRSFKVGYHSLFVLYGLPAKIVYKDLGVGPQDVDHLEYIPTNRDFVFLRNFKRFLPRLSNPKMMEKLIDLVKSFYGERKAEKVREYLESWGFLIKTFHGNVSQKEVKVVIA